MLVHSNNHTFSQYHVLTKFIMSGEEILIFIILGELKHIIFPQVINPYKVNRCVAIPLMTINLIFKNIYIIHYK